MIHEQFRPEDYGRCARDKLATMKQYARESVANFVYRFRATCLRVLDLSEAEKLDRFVRTLVQDVRLQVESRGPNNFHEAAMFAQRTDAVIMRVAGHNAQKAAKQKEKWGYSQHQPVPMKTSGEHSAQGGGGPEPMELGTTSRRTLTRAEYKKLPLRERVSSTRNLVISLENCPMKKRNSGNGMGR